MCSIMKGHQALHDYISRNVDIKSFLQKDLWKVGKKKSHFTRTVKMSINTKKVDIKEFYNLLHELQRQGLIVFNPVVYGEPENVLDCFILSIKNEYDSCKFTVIKDIEKIKIAKNETSEYIYYLIPIHNIINTFKNISNFEHYLQSHDIYYRLERINNIEIWNKRDAYFYIDKSSKFFISNNKIFIPSKIKKYPKQIVIKLSTKLFNLIRKIYLFRTTSILKNLSRSQYMCFNYLKNKLIKKEKINNFRMFVVNSNLLFLFTMFIYSIIHLYKIYLMERKKRKDINSFDQYISIYIKGWIPCI